jgi:phage N-6-adenine-methyltransferase
MNNVRKYEHHDSWQTPDWLCTALDHEFDFTLHACPLDPDWSPERVAQGLSVDSLTEDWSGPRVFCNPPYSDILPWVKKGLERKAQVVVFVLPANTATEWFHLLRDHGARFRFFRKRIKFWKNGDKDAKQNPTNGTVVAIVRAGDLIVIVIFFQGQGGPIMKGRYEIEGLSIQIPIRGSAAITARLLMAPIGRITRERGQVVLHLEHESDVKALRSLAAKYVLEYRYEVGSRYEKVAGIDHEPAPEEVEKNQKVAILSLHADDDGSVLCQAFDPPNGEIQPEELVDDPIVDAYMPPADTEEGDTEAEKQCVRSVLGNLAKLGYNRAVLWEGSELEPAWIKKMLKKWNPAKAA